MEHVMEKEIIALQCRITEQEKMIDDLSTTLTEQWKIIDAMQRKLDRLTERFLNVEEQIQPSIPITRPPHY